MRSAALLLLSFPLIAAAAGVSAEQSEFFESKIRPVLASACYDCHGAEKQKAGLRLDSREGLLKGGEGGAVVVPGDAEKSLLFQAIAGTHPELKMPKNSDPLSAGTIAAFREWIAMGAPDPRDKPPAVADGDWPAAFALRKQAWFWQPLKKSAPPEVPGVAHPVDRFLRAGQQKAGLTPSPRADGETIARRLAFVLTGLPPADGPDRPRMAYEAYAQSLLASPAFGERWARHWMDWLRYADSHGSEGDPAIPHAWQYRDYLIRALNADVPYFQLVREHLAGDLITPRLNKEGTLNESAIGPAHLRMVFHGFTPTDALDEFVTFTDNQVDVVSKAFLGLTVSCARCHNHKFDAISQEDYYAMFGVFANARPATVDVRARQNEAASRHRMEELKSEIADAVKKDWEASLKDFEQRLSKWQPKNDAERKEADADGCGPMSAWLAVREQPDDSKEFFGAWLDAYDRELIARKAQRDWHHECEHAGRARWDGAGGNIEWFGSGAGTTSAVDRSEVSILTEGEQLTDGLLPRSFSSDRYSARDRGVLTSSAVQADGGRLWVRACGKNAGLRYTVHNYPRSGLIYPKTALDSDRPRWFEFNLDYWKGESIHLEAWTAQDAPVEIGNGGGYFRILEVAYPGNSSLTPPPFPAGVFGFVQAEDVANRAQALAAYRDAVKSALTRKTSFGLRTAPEFLNFFVRAGLLPSAAKELPTAAPLVEEYRKLAAQLAAPIRAPGVMEGGPGDWPMYARGDHKKPGAPVPRRFLSALDATPYQTKESGRRELAESIAGPGSALASRVIVNRLWHHVFGRGIVATTDNFGKLGDLPTHPELLDWLAGEFQKSGGSIKAMLQLLVTSEAFMAQSAPSAEAAAKDPENKLLSHWSLRRLEAEAIRDAMLTVTGKLETGSSGPGVDGSSPRRSVYVRVIRNALDPFLTAFDAPVPSSTRGRRDATNVPAQALTLMNSPLVLSWARDWAGRVSAAVKNPREQIRRLYREGFQREPSPEEVTQCEEFMNQAFQGRSREREKVERNQRRSAELQQELAALTAPVMERLKAEKPAPVEVPAALAEWDFENEKAGTLPLTLHGGARVAEGALQLNGKDAWASTGPLERSVRARTLEAWVSLSTLDQGGGGVFTIQDLDGEVFDAIVFAEKDPRQWLAGSNFHQRTQTAGGPQEAEAAERPVHIAVTWAEDGTVRLFRDGAPYGQSYKSNGPITFEAGKSRIQFGCRHAQPSGNRLLSGRIWRARFYDRELPPEEIARTAALEGRYITPEVLLAAMTEPDRRKYRELKEQLVNIETMLALAPAEEMEGLQSLALALLNAKEFIYLR